MKNIMSIIVGGGIALSAAVARPVTAQWNVARYGEVRTHAYSTFGLEPAWAASLGYGRVFRVMGHDFQVSGDAAMVTAKADANDYRARLGTQTAIVQWRSLYLTGSGSFITRGTENDIYRGFNFGSDLTGTVGVYRHRFFAAGEFGFDKAIITHITNSDWYKALYPGAKDGWYLDAGGSYHTGVATGLALGNVEMMGRLGYYRTEKWGDQMPPLYATVGLGVGF